MRGQKRYFGIFEVLSVMGKPETSIENQIVHVLLHRAAQGIARYLFFFCQICSKRRGYHEDYKHINFEREIETMTFENDVGWKEDNEIFDLFLF